MADLASPSMQVCKSCGRAKPCGGDCTRDREAREWMARFAPEALSDLPSEFSTSRILGGNHERTDRGEAVDHLRRHVVKRAEHMELRHHLDVVTLRLQAIVRAQQAMATERERLELHARVLSLRTDGDGMELKEIAAAIGLRSHSSVSTILTEIKVEAQGRAKGEAIAVPCRCGRQGCMVVAHGTGRRAFRTRKCQDFVSNRRFVERRKLRRTHAAHGAPTPAACGEGAALLDFPTLRPPVSEAH